MMATFHRMGLFHQDIVGHCLGASPSSLNDDAFCRDYAEAHLKFSELGFISSDDEVEENCSTVLVQLFLPVAVTAVVAVLCYLFEVHRKNMVFITIIRCLRDLFGSSNNCSNGSFLRKALVSGWVGNCVHLLSFMGGPLLVANKL